MAYKKQIEDLRDENLEKAVGDASLVGDGDPKKERIAFLLLAIAIVGGVAVAILSMLSVFVQTLKTF